MLMNLDGKAICLYTILDGEVLNECVFSMLKQIL